MRSFSHSPHAPRDRPRVATLPRRTDIDYDAVPRPANFSELVISLKEALGNPEDGPTDEDIATALEAALYDVDRASEYLVATARPAAAAAAVPGLPQFPPQDLAQIRGLVDEITAESGRPLYDEERALLIQIFGLTDAPDPAARRAQVRELYDQLSVDCRP
jgi:hypothetical protein